MSEREFTRIVAYLVAEIMQIHQDVLDGCLDPEDAWDEVAEVLHQVLDGLVLQSDDLRLGDLAA